MSESAQIAITTVQSLLVILNIAGNSLVCVIIVKSQDMRTSVNYVLMNLAVADMTVGILFGPRFIPIHTFTHPDGVTGNVLCKLLTGGTWGLVGVSASVFSLVVIAIERYYAVVHPHRNKGRLSKRNMKVIIPCSWIFGVFMNIPWLLVTKYSKELGQCSEMWPEKWMAKADSLLRFLLMALFPVSLMAALYIRVVYTLWFKRGEPSQQQGVLKVRKRVTLTVVIVSVIFAGCYLTTSSNYLMRNYQPSRLFLTWKPSSIMVLLNSAINPIVYALVNERFREKLKRMMSCTCRHATGMVHPAREHHVHMMDVAIDPTHATQETVESCREHHDHMMDVAIDPTHPTQETVESCREHHDHMMDVAIDPTHPTQETVESCREHHDHMMDVAIDPTHPIQETVESCRE